MTMVDLEDEDFDTLFDDEEADGKYPLPTKSQAIRMWNKARRPSLKDIYNPEFCCVALQKQCKPLETTPIYFSPEFTFRIKWMIVLTSGFFINTLRIANTEILDNVDADTYYRANWYRLERLNQLELVQITCPTMTPANRLMLVVSHRSYRTLEFRASFVGSRLQRRY